MIIKSYLYLITKLFIGINHWIYQFNVRFFQSLRNCQDDKDYLKPGLCVPYKKFIGFNGFVPKIY